jgi:hypothetical protein
MSIKGTLGALLLASAAPYVQPDAILEIETAGGTSQAATVDQVRDGVNPKQYGARGDLQYVTDGVVTSGSGTLTSATANFQTSDVGKFIYVMDSTGALYRSGTITNRSGPTSVTISDAAANAYSGAQIIWYSQDDTTAILAAIAKAKVNGSRRVVLSSGNFPVSANLLTVTADRKGFTFEGAGKWATTLYPLPAFADKMFDHPGNAGGSLHLRNFGIFGYSRSFPQTGVSVINCGSGDSISFENFRLEKMKGYTVYLQGDGAVSAVNSEFEGASYNSVMVQGEANFLGCYTGNAGNAGLWSTAHTTWIGGTLDECGSGPSGYFTDGPATLIGAECYSYGGGQYALMFDNSALGHKHRVIGCRVKDWNGGNAGGITVLNAGARVYLAGNDIQGAGTLKAINNSAGGKLENGCGNRITGGSTTGAGLGEQIITTSAAIDPGLETITLTLPGSGSITPTLAAPTLADPMIKALVSTGSGGTIGMALTNAVGGTAATTCTWNAAGQRLILAKAGAKWEVLKQDGVTLS